MVSELTLTKGAYSVTIYANSVADSFDNKLFVITSITGVQNQAIGPGDNKIIDLLRMTRTWRIKAYILSTTDKANLIAIISGGGTAGGPITFTYDHGGNKTSFQVYCKSCFFSENPSDNPTSMPGEAYSYEIDISLVEGVQVG